MTNIIANRLKTIMQERGVNSTDLARKADVKATFIYDVLSGKSANPSTVKLAKVAESLGINLYYLLGKDDSTESLQLSVPPASEFVTVRMLQIDHVLNDVDKNIADKNSGPDYFRREWIQSRLRSNPDNLRMLHMHGDDMEPTLNKGDMVLVDISKKNPSPPGLFVIYDGLGFVVKRLEYISQSVPPRLTVLSDNTTYKAYERGLSETHIIGRVVWFSREL
jgi:phage repressor protein C with HTH and peptisase S24 domain